MKHKCQICQWIIDDSIGITHIKAKEYLVKLIKHNHPEWNRKDKACPKCIEYYRRKVLEVEI
jgi:hypothetical protein